jgi:hypothetical protein
VGDDEFGLALRRFCSSSSFLTAFSMCLAICGFQPGARDLDPSNALSFYPPIFPSLHIFISLSLHLFESLYLSSLSFYIHICLFCPAPWTHIDCFWMKCSTRARRRIEKACVADCMTSSRDHGTGVCIVMSGPDDRGFITQASTHAHCGWRVFAPARCKRVAAAAPHKSIEPSCTLARAMPFAHILLLHAADWQRPCLFTLVSDWCYGKTGRKPPGGE